MPVGEIKEILERLGCVVASEGITAAGRELLVTVPTFRRDLEREIDLIEEVARIFGLDRLPATLPARRVGRGGLNVDQRRLRTVADVLQGAGLNEAVTFSFIDPTWMDRLQLAPDDVRRTDGSARPTRSAATSRSCALCSCPGCWRPPNAT